MNKSKLKAGMHVHRFDSSSAILMPSAKKTKFVDLIHMALTQRLTEFYLFFPTPFQWGARICRYLRILKQTGHFFSLKQYRFQGKKH